MAIVAGACGGSDAESIQADLEPPSQVTSVSPSLTTNDPGPTRTSPQSVDVVRLAEFVVDGATVRTTTALSELPERATEVEFSGTHIDEGDGFMMCLGGTLDSEPPQCSGPIVDGLETATWATTLAGVSYGDRTVSVSWPPAAGRVALVGERTFESRVPQNLPLELPPECEGIERPVGRDILADYAQQHPDTTAHFYVVGRDNFVLWVSGDIEAVRTELSGGGATPCLQQVEFSTSELEAAHNSIRPSMSDDAMYISSIGRTNADNRVRVGVAVVDAVTVRQLVGLVDDPSILLISSITSTLAGT